MNISKTIKQRASYLITAGLLALGVFTPVFISGVVSADQVSNRSIALSSSSANASAVTYGATFTPPQASGAFAILFCSNSPLPGVNCAAPAGFDATGATTTSPGATIGTAATNSVIVTGTFTAATEIAVELNAIHNPTTSGPLYARISTYVDATAAGTDIGASGTSQGVLGIDNGGVAISITPTIGVSGAVLESLTFCVANAVITKDCANASSNLPTLELGETVGNTKALIASAISTGTLYTQISTNAATGAVINLKSATDCGGLKRFGASVCDIAPALQTDILAGQAKFGVKIGTASGTDGSATGIIQPVSGSGYGTGAFALNYLGTNATGVTSPIGDPFLDTGGAPVNNQNMTFIFGASVTNSTPAGSYATSLSMIATGKF